MRALLAACLLASASASAQNVLVVVADDVGVDRVAVYAEHPDPGNTPNIDALARRGVLFRNAWATPLCTPTRSLILTGRYGFRTGIGTIVRGDLAGHGLPVGERTLPRLLPERYTSAAVGKWHLGGIPEGPEHARHCGFDRFLGQRFNVEWQGGTYSRWHKTVDGRTEVFEGYLTTDITNDALRLAEELPEPWFLYVCYNNAHVPIHAPPAELHGFTLEGEPTEDVPLHHKAMVQALDTEFGRLLRAVDEEDTTVLFLGDNGTDRGAITQPFDPLHGKGTMYEGGVRVPFIAAGARVTARGVECAGLVSAVDLFATVLEIAGVESQAEDSVSLLPYFTDPDRPSLRPFLYTELFRPNGFGPKHFDNRAVRDERYKLIVNELEGRDRFFDLLEDPHEQQSLRRRARTPAQQAGYLRLKRALADLRR